MNLTDAITKPAPMLVLEVLIAGQTAFQAKWAVGSLPPETENILYQRWAFTIAKAARESYPGVVCAYIGNTSTGVLRLVS